MYKAIKFAVFLFLLLNFSGSYSQNKSIDSLKRVLANPKISDTIRINMIKAAMDKTVGWSEEHIALYKMLPPIFSRGLKQKNLNPKVKRNYLDAAGCYYYYTAKKETTQGDEKAIGHFDQAIDYFKASKEYDQVAEAITGKGSYFLSVNDWPNTFKCYFAALKFYESIQNESGISDVNKELGTACVAQRDWEKAIVYFQKAIKYYDAIPSSRLTISDRHELSVIMNNVGVAYTRLKNFPEAHKSYLKAYQYIKPNNDLQAEAMILVQLANSSNDMGNVAEAQQYLDQALDLCKDDIARLAVYGNASRIYYKNKNYDKAAQYGELAYALAKKNKNVRSMSGASVTLNKTYRESGQFEKALNMYEISVKLSDSAKFEASKNELAQQQIKYDFEKKELQQKIIQEKKLSALKVESEKKTALETSKNKLAQQQLKYDFDKKELKQKLIQGKKMSAIRLDGEKKAAAIKLDGEKKTAARTNWLVALSGILLLLLLGIYFYYRNNRQKQSIAVLEKNQIRQKLLITQMNPHFIFNSVQNIRNLIDNQKNSDAVKYLDKFSILTRQILENSNENYISLEEEVEMIQNYLVIQQLLYNHKFDFKVTVDDAIDTESAFLPPMLTQPFIENAIKHGLSNKENNGMIDILFYIKDSKLFFQVCDNGKGFDSGESTSNHKSFAMAITRERLVGYTKNQDFTVKADNITDRDGNVAGAKVSFEIPYIYEN